MNFVNSKYFIYNSKYLNHKLVECSETKELYTGICINVQRYHNNTGGYKKKDTDVIDSLILTFVDGKITCVEKRKYLKRQNKTAQLSQVYLGDIIFNSSLSIDYDRAGKINNSHISYKSTSPEGDTTRKTQTGSGMHKGELEYITHYGSVNTNRENFKYDSTWWYENNELLSVQTYFDSHMKSRTNPYENQIDIEGTQLANGDTVQYLKRVDGLFDGLIIIHNSYYPDDTTTIHTSIRSIWDHGTLISLNTGDIQLVNSKYKQISEEHFLKKFKKMQSKVKGKWKLQFDFEYALIESKKTSGTIVLVLPK